MVVSADCGRGSAGCRIALTATYTATARITCEDLIKANICSPSRIPSAFTLSLVTVATSLRPPANCNSTSAFTAPSRQATTVPLSALRALVRTPGGASTTNEDLINAIALPDQDDPASFGPLGVGRISFGPFLQAALAGRAKELLARWG